MTTEEGNKLIAEFMGVKPTNVNEQVYNIPEFGCMHFTQMKYDSSWDWLMPVYRKTAEIGLWMMTNGYDKAWIEKGKEIEYAILTEETPQRAATLIAQLIEWYNQQQKTK